MDCRLSDIRTLTSVLRAMQLENNKNECINCHFSEKGLKFSSNSRGKDVLATCWIPSSVFQEFNFELQEDSAACVDLALPVLIHCLHVFGVSANLQLQYVPDQAVLVLILGEAGALTECRLRVYTPDEQDDRNWLHRHQDLQNPDAVDSVVMTPGVLAEAIQDLKDEARDSKVLLRLTPQTHHSDASVPVFTIGLQTQNTSVQWDMTRDPHVFHKFDVRHFHRHVYVLSGFISSLRALTIAHSVKLRLTTSGILFFTMLTKTSDASERIFLEFVILPITDGEKVAHASSTLRTKSGGHSTEASLDSQC